MDDYNTAFDIGVAVKEDSPTISKSKRQNHDASSANKSKGKKRRRKRSASDASASSLGNDSAASTKVSNAQRNPMSPNDSTANRNGDSPNTDFASTEKKKKKRKKKKKKKSMSHDGSNSANEETSPAKSPKLDNKKYDSSLPPLAPLKGMFIKERSNLPVYQHRTEICKLVAKNDVVLVVAETVSVVFLLLFFNFS